MIVIVPFWEGMIYIVAGFIIGLSVPFQYRFLLKVTGYTKK